jgi:hypothetical protein
MQRLFNSPDQDNRFARKRVRERLHELLGPGTREIAGPNPAGVMWRRRQPSAADRLSRSTRERPQQLSGIAFLLKAPLGARSPWRRSASPQPGGASRSPDAQEAAARVKAEDSIASGVCDALERNHRSRRPLRPATAWLMVFVQLSSLLRGHRHARIGRGSGSVASLETTTRGLRRIGQEHCCAAAGKPPAERPAPAPRRRLLPLARLGERTGGLLPTGGNGLKRARAG